MSTEQTGRIVSAEEAWLVGLPGRASSAASYPDLAHTVQVQAEQIAAVLELHPKVVTYAYCEGGNECNTDDVNHTEDTRDGDLIHLNEPQGAECGTCRDEDGEHWSYPCPTARIFWPERKIALALGVTE